MVNNMNPFAGYHLVRDCMKYGHYRPKTHGGNFELWLFFKCGEVIEKYELSHKTYYLRGFL
jgi:hypothetical protein